MTRISRTDVGVDLSGERVVTFEFRPPAGNRTFLAAAHPLRPGGDTGPIFGYLIVAKEKSELRDAWVTLLSRLAIAFLVALVVVGALALYLSRRITRPVLALSDAADEVSKGRYDVEVPHVPGGGEIGHLADRFREMTARLAEAEELERNFLMSVSHELRTPLTAIRGHVAALREGVVSDPETIDASLQTVAEEAERLGRLVGDVLDLAKLDAHRFTVLTEEVDMGRLLEHAFSTFAEEARQRGIEYTSEADAAPVIVSDGDRVLQIISNLLSNAFRWTPDGGRIDLALQADNGVVTVDVADSGPGIGADARERIFRPFWSTDGRGTGLGLPIARELAMALGGRIELQSELGKGSRFRLVLPNRSCLLGRFAVLVRGRDGVLDPLQPLADALPARGDELDEQGEVVDAGVPLGEDVAFEPLEPADHLVQQPTDLGEAASDREHLGAKSVVDRRADLLGQRPFELGGGRGERLDLDPRALERGFELGRSDPSGRGFGDAGLGPFECLLVHAQEATLAVGWTPPSSTTTCPRS